MLWPQVTIWQRRKYRWYICNSREGNILNPVASLLHWKVYGIPAIFIISWRGEPGVYDESQHVYQGEIILKPLADMDISAFVVEESTTIAELKCKMDKFRENLSAGSR